MISFFIIVIKVVFLLGFLILIHETGHFLVARLCKIKVNEFAIGFGPTLWKKETKQTKYALRLIPLGGFVSMEGEEERSNLEGSFSRASIPKRIAVVAAGGLVNIVFAILIYFLLTSFSGNFISQKVAQVTENYAAQVAGILPGDEIIRINNKRIRNKNDVQEILEKAQGREVVVELKRNGETKQVNVTPTSVPTRDTGIYLGVQQEEVTAKIVSIYPASPAEKAGLEINDEIKKINGIEVGNDPYRVVELIRDAQDGEITFTIQRKEQELEISLIPNLIHTYLLGVQFEKAENTIANNIYYGFWDTNDFLLSIVDNLTMLFTGKVSTDQLMGPIGISGVVAETKGITDFIYILALVSLSLGVTNLLPFPPLDGGKIVILLVEAIRRKPLKENIEVAIQMAGFAILIGLSIYVTYHDILRL